MEYVVAPRAYWKGYLKLSLVSCPVALFPASSEREKISFNQINKKTGNRIRYRKVDAETGDEVGPSEIIKGYEVGKGQYIELEPAELEAIAIATAAARLRGRAVGQCPGPPIPKDRAAHGRSAARVCSGVTGVCGRRQKAGPASASSPSTFTAS
jgi:hypothetical protein